MNADEREGLRGEALTNPAPRVAGFTLRPFNDGTMSLCAQLGLSLFTLEMLDGAEGADASAQTASALGKLGFAEVNRQCHFLFFMLGYGRQVLPPDDDPEFAAKVAAADAAENRAIMEMIRLVNDPEAYRAQVMPWLMKQRYEGSLVPQMLGEWSRFMRHYLAASVKILPKDDEEKDKPREPKN